MTERNERFDQNGNLLGYVVPNYDGTGTEYDADGNEVGTVDMEPPAPPVLSDVEKLAKQLLTPKIAAREFNDDELDEVADLFPFWVPNLTVEVGEIYRSPGGRLVEVIQAHTTQADWTPDVVPALFKVHRDPNSTEWEAGISVSVDEEYTYQGIAYRVLQAHTTQVGWEPPNVPALWAVV